jgi:hypothetical protein
VDRDTPVRRTVKRTAKRTYELKRRAERQDQTRQRIVDATIALHTTIGPARTTVSAIAAPLPDASVWQTLADPERRLRRGFAELYAYYARHGDELAPILRDVEHHALTRELIDLRLRPALDRIAAVLAEPFHARGDRQRRLLAMLELFMQLYTWKMLARTLPAEETVEAAVRAILTARFR